MPHFRDYLTLFLSATAASIPTSALAAHGGSFSTQSGSFPCNNNRSNICTINSNITVSAPIVRERHAAAPQLNIQRSGRLSDVWLDNSVGLININDSVADTGTINNQGYLGKNRRNDYSIKSIGMLFVTNSGTISGNIYTNQTLHLRSNTGSIAGIEIHEYRSNRYLYSEINNSGNIGSITNQRGIIRFKVASDF